MPAAPKAVTAAVLIIGNEILSGRTQDANLTFLATRLNELGVQVAEARVVRDDTAIIVDALNALRAAHDYVFTTGGIGPTHDDITSASVAEAFGLPFGPNAEAEAVLHAYYGDDATTERMSMADMPAGAVLIDNPVSRAPGFQIENVFVLPGVPRILQAMFEGLLHRLVGGLPVLSKSITTAMPEGVLAGPLAKAQAAHPDVEMGSYPFFRAGELGANLVLRSTDEKKLEAAAESVRDMVRGLGGTPVEDEVGG